QMKVLVAGFWCTWPAEQVDGVMISSYTSARYGRSKKGTFLKDFPHQTYPESLAGDLQPALEQAIAHGKERAGGAAARFHPTPRPLREDELKPIDRFVVAAPAENDHQRNPQDSAEQLVWIATSDTFFDLAAAKLWPASKPDLTIVYTGEVDVTSHDWW